MQTENRFWSFLKNPATLSQVARAGGTPGEFRLHQRDRDVLLVPAEASVQGGEPILLLLPEAQQGAERLSADCRYCLVFEGSKRRHLASCELALAQRGLFSRVPEHDIPEPVELSVFADSQRLHSLTFNFTPDPLLDVASDIADAFPLVPESLNSLCDSSTASAASSAAADTDRRLCAALRKAPSVAAAVAEAAEAPREQPRRTVFHCLAEAGWLESLAHLLRLTGRPEFWLLSPPEAGPAAVQLVRDRRFRSVLECPSRLRDWLEQLDGRGSRLQGQEEAVVSVRSWLTPAGASLVIMTTNKEKADTPLEQDLALFPTLEAGHVEDHYLLKSPQTHDPVPGPMTAIETACAQTEIGRSIEDLLGGPGEQAGVTAALPGSGQFAETDSLELGPSGEMRMSHSMSQSMSPSMSHSQSNSMMHSMTHSMTHSMSHSMMQSALFETASEEAWAQQQQQQPSGPSRSISTTSLIEEAAIEQRNRKKRKSFLSRLSGSHRSKSGSGDSGGSGSVGGKIKGSGRSKLPMQYEHSWCVASSGLCAVCETNLSRVCLLSCRACHLTVHNAETCRAQTVSCLPPSCGVATGAGSPESGLVSATPPASRSHSIPGSPMRYLTEVTEEPFRDWKHPGGGAGGNQTLPRNFSNSAATAIGDGLDSCDTAAGSQQHQQPAASINRNMRANSVSNDRRGPSGGADSADSSGATWQASATASLRPNSVLPAAGGGGVGGASAVQQLSEHLARLSDKRLESLSSESLRRVASWSETQDKRQLKRCGEKLARRCNFIYELVSTEVSYLKNICVLRAVFRDPLRLFFNATEVDKLFPHLDELEELHSRLLDDLRGCEPPQDRAPADWPGLGRVGAVIRQHLGGSRGGQWLRAYSGFCSEHTVRLQRAPAGIAQRWPEFSDLLQQCERSPLAGRKTLQDYYLMLTQRLSKYKTLFPQISEYCQLAPEDPEMPRACQDLDRLLEGVNAAVESSHNRHLLERIAAGFQPSPEQSSLSADQLLSRRLLHSGQLKLEIKDLKAPVLCFGVLLNDMLVFLQELPGGRYSPLSCPSRYVPVIHFSETDAIVRENETAKSKATFFVIIKKPDPALINLACMSLEERNKWLRRINQVRDSNPRADERALEAEKRLREKSKVSAELLASMEAKDRELGSLLNEKSQLWKQLLGLWSPSEPAAPTERDTDPDQLLRQALQELDGLRRLVHSAPAFAAGAAAAAAASEASGGSLTRSASNAEDKAASTVSLPKRADTFSGYDSRQQQRQPAPAAQVEQLEGSDTLLAQSLQQQQPPPLPPPPQTPQPTTPVQSKSATSASSTSLAAKARRRSVAAETVSEAFGSREKNRRPSVFELMFKRPQRDAQSSSVSEEDSGGSDPELRQPDAAGLASLDRLHSLVTGLCRDLLAARTRLAERFKEEARLRQELDTLRAARENEGHRSQDSLLETIRLQRAELEAEKARFRESQRRDQARLETRKEDLERKEEALRQRQDDLERQMASLTEQKRTLQMQLDQYKSLQLQHAKSFSDDLSEQPQVSLPPPQQQHAPGRPHHHQPSPSAVLLVPAASGGGSGAGGSLTVSSAKGHSKSASNLAATTVQQAQIPAHLTSRLVEDRLARENGAGPASLTSPTHAATASLRLSPSQSISSGGGAAASTALSPQLPLHLASDSKKRKGSSSVFKVRRRNGEPGDPAVN